MSSIERKYVDDPSEIFASIATSNNRFASKRMRVGDSDVRPADDVADAIVVDHAKMWNFF